MRNVGQALVRLAQLTRHVWEPSLARARRDRGAVAVGQPEQARHVRRDQEEAPVAERRLLGIDLGITTAHKVRIRDLARQLVPHPQRRRRQRATRRRPGRPGTLRRPRALLDAGHERVAELLRAGSSARMSPAKVQSRARAWVGVAKAAVDLYGDDGAMPYADLAAELATEARLPRAVQAEQKPHRQARERAYLRVEPDELARTLPGIAEVGAPLLVAAIGRAQRFASAAKFKAFTGLTPKASETGETDRKGQAITKAGTARLRKQLLCSANPAGRSTRSSPRYTTPRWSSVAPTSRAELGRPSPRPILGPRPRNGQPLSDASRDVTPESPGRTTR
jgi:transposase